MQIPPGTTSLSVTVSIYDDDGLPLSGLTASNFPPTKWCIGGGDDQSITLVDLGAIGDAWAEGGVIYLGNGGKYRLDLPDDVGEDVGQITIWGEDTNKHLLAEPIQVKADAPTAAEIADVIETRFSGSTITVETNFDDESEELNVKRTDDYTSNTGQEITFTATGFDAFPTDSVYFRASRDGNLLFDEVLCTTTVLTPTTQSVTLQLTRDQIVLLNYGAVDDYRFRCTYVENTDPDPDEDNGEYRTIRWGKINCERVGA